MNKFIKIIFDALIEFNHSNFESLGYYRKLKPDNKLEMNSNSI